MKNSEVVQCDEKYIVEYKVFIKDIYSNNWAYLRIYMYIKYLVYVLSAVENEIFCE